MVYHHVHFLDHRFNSKSTDEDEGLFSIHITTIANSSIWQNGMEFTIQLETGTKRCKTSKFTTWSKSSNSWSADHSVLHRRSELDACRLHKINETTKIRYMRHNIFGSKISKFSFATDGRIVTGWTCNVSDSSNVLQKNKFSQWYSCKRSKVLDKIKFHTSNEINSGTDSSKKVTFRVIKGKKEVRFQYNDKTCKPDKCNHCIDPCRYREGNKKYDYTWCHKENNSWDYCELDPNFAFQEELHNNGTKLKTKDGHECNIQNKKYCGYHGKKYTWCYYNDNKNWDYCEIPEKRLATATETLYKCTTWTLDNVGNDIERGQTDIYYGKQLGSCNYKDLVDIEEDVGTRFTLQVDIEKYGGVNHDMWQPDLLKLYWQNIGTLTCKLCNDCTDGFGVKLSSGLYHFECDLLNSGPGLESIEITGCENYEGYTSSDSAKLRICETREAFDASFSK